MRLNSASDVRHFGLKILFIALVVAVGLPLYAETHFEKTDRYLTFSTPFADLTKNEQKQIVKTSLKLLIGWLEERFSNDSLDALTQVDQHSSAILEQIAEQRVSQLKADGNLKYQKLLPTAFSIYVGGGASGAWLLGAGGSLNLFLIVMPVKVMRVDRLKKETKVFLELHTAWRSLPLLSISTGAGGGFRLTAGIGFIWGPLASPGDFLGSVYQTEYVVNAGVGFSTVAGLLSQNEELTLQAQNPFMTVGLNLGANLSAEILHGASRVGKANNILNILGITETPHFSVLLKSYKREKDLNVIEQTMKLIRDYFIPAACTTNSKKALE